MIGVSFDPAQDQYQQNGQSGPNASTAPRGIQEAIKILSLRLPKVLGANAVSPRALLTAPGAGAGGNVDGVVQKIIQKYFPQASPDTLNPMFAPVVGQPGPDRSTTMPVGDRVKQDPFRPTQTQSILTPRGPSVKVDKPVVPPQQTQMPRTDGGGDNPYQDMTFVPPPPPNPFLFPMAPPDERIYEI